MNAQEALDFITSLTIEQATNPTADVAKMYLASEKILQQLIDQSNAKPKTLEELGWEYGLIVDEQIVYTKKLFTSISATIRFNKPLSFVTVFCELGEEKLSPILFHEELLAIAEKMKELGMTGDQSPKEN